MKFESLLVIQTKSDMSAHATQPGLASPRTLLRSGSRILEWNNHRAGKYARGRYGRFWGQCLISFTEATVERLARLEQNVINGRDEALVAFKESLAGELSMIAVAVSRLVIHVF